MLANSFCIAVLLIVLLGAGIFNLTTASHHPFVDRTYNTADRPTANQYDQHQRDIGYLDGEGTLLYASNIDENANHDTEVLGDPTQKGTSDASQPQIPNDVDSTQAVQASIDHRFHRDAQSQPGWYGRYGRTFHTNKKYSEHKYVARENDEMNAGGLREGVEADRSDKIQNSNFINIDPQSHAIAKAEAATGAKITGHEDIQFPRHARETGNPQPTWSAREVNDVIQKPLQNAMFGREARDGKQQPLWSSSSEREVSDRLQEPLWSARYGREAIESKQQPLWSARFGREASDGKQLPLWSARFGRDANDGKQQPLWSARFGREANDGKQQPLWTAKFGREANDGKQQPLWSARFGREANDGKQRPLWTARFGREANDGKQQLLWSARFGREANDRKQQPLWSARFGREANDGKQQPLWSARFGREANDGKQQPLWSARFGREANEGKQQPLWTARFGREANDGKQQPLWSARFGREAEEGKPQPPWSARFGRKADRIERPMGYVELRRGTNGFYHGREDGEATMEDNIGQKPRFVHGFADDSTGKQVIFKLRELKRLLTHKDRERKEVKYMPISAEIMGSRDADLQPQKPIEIKNRGHLFKWRRPTKEELQRIDDVVHEELQSKS